MRVCCARCCVRNGLVNIQMSKLFKIGEYPNSLYVSRVAVYAVRVLVRCLCHRLSVFVCMLWCVFDVIQTVLNTIHTCTKMWL